MKFWPYDNFEIYSTYDSAEAHLRLRQEVLGLGSIYHKSIPFFVGSIEDNHFELSNYINYRNSFQPIIKGDIYDHPIGSKIVIKIKLVGSGTVFIILCLSFLVFGGILEFITSPNEGIFTRNLVILFIMFALIYALSMFAFLYEARKSKFKLSEIFIKDQEE